MQPADDNSFVDALPVRYANMKCRRRVVLGLDRFSIQSVREALVGSTIATVLAAGAMAQVDPNQLAASARQAMAEQRFSQAAEIYAELANKFPSEPTLLANLGMALHFGGQDARAIQPLKKAAKAMPSSFPAHFALGGSLSRLGRNSEAVAPLRKSIQINPEHPFAHALLGEALEAVGQHSEAAPVWQSLAALDASNPYAYAGLVRCNEELAAIAIDQLRQRDPESSYMLRILGRTRLAAQQYPSALYLFRSSLERQPGVRAVHEAVASVYQGAGQPEWAKIEREKAAALPEPDCTSTQSAECNFAAGRFDLAPSVAENSSSSDLFWAARSYASLAEQAFEKLTFLPETIEKLTLVTDVFASQGQYSSAADTCRRALEMSGGSKDLEQQLAELLYLARRIEEARPLLRRFNDSDPNDPRWAAMLGSLLAEEQEYEMAIPLLQSSLALPGAPASVRLDLGRSYLALDQPSEALPHLKSSVGFDTDGSVHYQLAQAFQRLGMREEAREALAQYRALDARKRQQTEAGASLDITPPE